MSEQNGGEVSRRAFLRTAFGVPVGVVAAAAVTPLAGAAASAVEQLTPIETGNAYQEQRDASEWDADAREHQVREALLAGPLREEALFRALPSVVYDALRAMASDGEEVHLLRDALLSREWTGPGLTRGEVLTGIVLSALTSLAHNVTPKGFDTDRVPLQQTLGGLLLWYLQRKFGLASNTAAHVAHNGLALQFGPSSPLKR